MVDYADAFNRISAFLLNLLLMIQWLGDQVGSYFINNFAVVVSTLIALGVSAIFLSLLLKITGIG